MKLILISPYPSIQAFGIRTLSGCLKKEGHDVQIIFLRKNFWERYETKILDEIIDLSRGTNLIGISLMTNYFDNAVQVTKRLKENLSIPILWGGIHPTIRPNECLDYADMVCLGEGEETLVELARKMQEGEDFHNVQGMWFKDKEKIFKNKLRPLIQDLDSLPFPDYDYENHYILSDGRIKKMDENLLKIGLERSYFTMATRGCCFGCAYCCNNTLNEMYPNQKPARKRSVNNIIRELVLIKSSWSFLTNIFFEDDNFFMYTEEEIKEFSKNYRQNIGLPLDVGGINPLNLTREKLSLLVDAGLASTRMGIQTGCERTKRLYKRHDSNQQVEKAVKIINEFKDKIPRPKYDIILDNPWETEADLIETLMFLSKLPAPYMLVIYSLIFYPETELYRKAKKDGIISDDLNRVYRKSYYGCKNTYLYRIFLLLNQHVSTGSRISPKIMFLMTNRKSRQLKLSQLLFIILKITGSFKRLKFLLYEGFKDILKGDRSRIIKYLERGPWGPFLKVLVLNLKCQETGRCKIIYSILKSPRKWFFS